MNVVFSLRRSVVIDFRTLVLYSGRVLNVACMLLEHMLEVALQLYSHRSDAVNLEYGRKVAVHLEFSETSRREDK